MESVLAAAGSFSALLLVGRHSEGLAGAAAPTAACCELLACRNNGAPAEGLGMQASGSSLLRTRVHRR